MNKNLIPVLALAAVVWSCDTKEKAQLKAKVDSLNVELEAREKATSELQEVGVLLDSIDVNRQLLRSNMVEGTSYKDYSSRLTNLNNYVKETHSKLDELEKSLKKSKSSSAGLYATIKRLKADLETSTQQLAVLTEEGNRLRSENQLLSSNLNQRDSLLNERAEFIKVKEQDLASLENKVLQINEQSRLNQADLYFAQAQALEIAAKRTKFAPRKKKETQREALELYKMAFSLGKSEAQNKIAELEKVIG